MSHRDKGKIHSSEQVWDKYEMKLVVCVLDVQEIPYTKKKLETYVKISIGKQSHRTKSVKKKRDPEFKELFFFDIRMHKESPVVFDVINCGGLTESKIGALKFDTPTTIQEEKVIDQVYDLTQSKKGKEKSSRGGKIHLRFYFSRSAESRPPSAALEHSFYYDSVMNQFETGDLITFSDIGVLGALTKVCSNSVYSRVGMVVKLPNKWTGRIEPYLLEVTRNIDNFLDAFQEKSRAGICLFRILERIHHHNGHSIWWSRLKKQLNEGEKVKMVEWMWSQHSTRTVDTLGQAFKTNHTQAVNFLSSFLGVPRHSRRVRDYCEYFSVSFFAHMLRLAGREIPEEKEDVFPVHVVKSGHYEDPVLIRGSKWEMEEKAKAKYQENAQQSQAFQAPHSYYGGSSQPNTSRRSTVGNEQPQMSQQTSQPSQFSQADQTSDRSQSFQDPSEYPSVVQGQPPSQADPPSSPHSHPPSLDDSSEDDASEKGGPSAPLQIGNAQSATLGDPLKSEEKKMERTESYPAHRSPYYQDGAGAAGAGAGGGWGEGTVGA
eukprot:CAMPEP_0201517446 /NCGR_PEP_ID=MMETSP0161_2-20130828/8547_1 /ASSEMBLY_ACC=CAM_ASM_000251 /TAXON_ID=180227 /ORGANISM="Neoparamoeba aestuarina, Strain SoJaBio B1-5/56/2" /LENGTH=544 /DNA_ID=CAMNT_0047914943 /DNA_START=116 /DNA_END=1747 /DNA_ORIENTATION=+